MATSNSTFLALFQSALGSPFTDKNGQVTIGWRNFFQALAAAAGDSTTGNTVLQPVATDSIADLYSQQIADLKQQVFSLSTNPALAVALQALEQTTSTSTIPLSESGIVLGTLQSLAILPDSNANIDFTVSWNDVSSTGLIAANSAFGSSNSNTQTILCGPPLPFGYSDVQFLTLVNNDVIAANVPLYYSEFGSNTHVVMDLYLGAGYTAVFDDNGFRVLNASGVPVRH